MFGGFEELVGEGLLEAYSAVQVGVPEVIAHSHRITKKGIWAICLLAGGNYAPYKMPDWVLNDITGGRGIN